MIIQNDIIGLNQAEGSAVTVGKFDGLHLGHQKILSEMVLKAREKGLLSVVLAVCTPGAPRIFTVEEMAGILEDAGVDVFLPVPFTEAFRETPAETFLQRDLLGKLRMKALFSGEDFRFGKGGLGDAAFLEKESREKGFELKVIPDLSVNGEIVKSSLIRERLSAMDVQSAGQMLGRSYSVSGVVGHGRKLGSRIGYPTVNIVPAPDKFLPGYGVYAAELAVEGEERPYRGVLDLGVKPTVQGNGDPAAEVHLFDFDGDLYGKRVTASFLKEVRPEKRFSSVQDLRKQIAKDIENVQQMFKE